MSSPPHTLAGCMNDSLVLLHCPLAFSLISSWRLFLFSRSPRDPVFFAYRHVIDVVDPTRVFPIIPASCSCVFRRLVSPSSSNLPSPAASFVAWLRNIVSRNRYGILSAHFRVERFLLPCLIPLFRVCYVLLHPLASQSSRCRLPVLPGFSSPDCFLAAALTVSYPRHPLRRLGCTDLFSLHFTFPDPINTATSSPLCFPLFFNPDANLWRICLSP